ncbi:MAG: hypothetical protein ABH816_01730 [Candidatus Levyibacteriota bacterium]
MPDIFIPNEREKPKVEHKIPTGLPRRVHHLASFCQRPTGISFQNQHEEEEILLFLRRHFITNIPWIFLTLIFVLLPFVFFFANSSFSLIGFDNIPKVFITISVVFYYLIVLNYILLNFMSWFYNVTIVTSERIVDIDFSDLVYHDMAATKLSLIEELRYTQVGFIETFFNYGNLFVQTAGENPNIETLSFPKPNKATQIIQELIGREEK